MIVLRPHRFHGGLRSDVPSGLGATQNQDRLEAVACKDLAAGAQAVLHSNQDKKPVPLARINFPISKRNAFRAGRKFGRAN
jgi:hypothetical protein